MYNYSQSYAPLPPHSTHTFHTQAQEYCNLGHVLSLWETLSVELATQLTLNGQEPFDSVKKDFLEPLSEGNQRDLEKCLGSFSLKQLLGALFEFTETFIKHSPAKDLM